MGLGINIKLFFNNTLKIIKGQSFNLEKWGKIWQGLK